jgi:phosphoribosylanthranilate isomerase
MTRVKICGLTRAADLAVAVEAGADAVGLIAGVTVETPREIDFETAADLATGVPPFVDSVLVTMPEGAGEARERIERTGVDAVQVHGLTPEAVASLAGDGTDVIAAVGPTDPDIDAYAAAADALLVDSIDGDGGGGTGETHDWERTREHVADLDVPVILAGGLTPENVAEAVETVRPFAVDTASGTEREGGVKDHDAVRQFVRRATRARVAP